MSTWMLTATGHEYHLSGSGLCGNQFDVGAIAHALAQINRFSGHASRPYSVAEHSLLCADIAERMQLPPIVQYAALMHDAHEAFTGDTSTPAKIAIGPGWTEFENTHARALRRFFGLVPTFTSMRNQLRQIDLVALATERRDLMPWNAEIHDGWPILDTPGKVVPEADWVDLNSARRNAQQWSEWRDQFMERYHAVRAANALWFKENVREQLP